MKKLIKYLVWFLALVLIMLVLMMVATKVTQGQIDLSLNITRYQGSLNKVEFWLKNFPTDIFQHPLLKQLEKPISLPLEIGAKGLANPFLPPLSPVQSLLKGLKKSL